MLVSFVCFCIGFVHDLLTSQGVFSDHDDHDLTDVYADLEISYHETIRQEYIAHAKSKYRVSINALKSLGFEEMKFYNEVLPWFGFTQGRRCIFSALGALLSPSIMAIGKKFSIKLFSLAMVSQKNFTYACVMQMGVSFYTKFTDGTFWISSNYWGIEINDDSAKVYKESRLRPVETAWSDHQQKVKQFIEEGKYVVERLGFDNYIELDKSLADYMRKRMTKLSTAYPEKEPSFWAQMAASFAGMGVFIFGVFFLIFLFNVVSNLYPACTFVEKLRIMPLPGHFMLLVALLGGSWLLARAQDALLTVNGSGTVLYGRAAVPTGQGYVSTKWLVFAMIPLIPVRSYWVINQYLNPRTKRQNFQMQPLPTIFGRRLSNRSNVAMALCDIYFLNGGYGFVVDMAMR